MIERRHFFVDRGREQKAVLHESSWRIHSPEFFLERSRIHSSLTIALGPTQRTRREGESSVQSSRTTLTTTRGRGRRRHWSSLLRRRRASSRPVDAAPRLPGDEPVAGARGIARSSALFLLLEEGRERERGGKERERGSKEIVRRRAHFKEKKKSKKRERRKNRPRHTLSTPLRATPSRSHGTFPDPGAHTQPSLASATVAWREGGSQRCERKGGTE